MLRNELAEGQDRGQTTLENNHEMCADPVAATAAPHAIVLELTDILFPQKSQE